MFASIAPYMVVSNAAAMPAPIFDGSSMLLSMATRPMSVPIMPNAGAYLPIASSMPLPRSWRSMRFSSSVSMTCSITSGSVPSTAI